MARSVPPDELDVTTLRWVLGRLGTPDFVPTVPPSTVSNLPTPWDPHLTCKVQINPALLPLSGNDPEQIAQYLTLLADQIREGLWDVGIHCMGRVR